MDSYFTYKEDDDLSSFLTKDLTKITDSIYLGSFDGVRSPKFLKELGITHILNCTKEVPMPSHDYIPKENQYRFNIARMRTLLVCDSEKREYVKSETLKVLKWMTEVEEKGGKIAVYCIAGCHRSPGMVQLWLLYDAFRKNKQLEPVGAFIETQSKRKQSEFVYENFITEASKWFK